MNLKKMIPQKVGASPGKIVLIAVLAASLLGVIAMNNDQPSSTEFEAEAAAIPPHSDAPSLRTNRSSSPGNGSVRNRIPGRVNNRGLGVSGRQDISVVKFDIDDVLKHDPFSLAEALKKLLRDADLRVKLSQNARRLMEKEFDIHKNAARLRKHFNCEIPVANSVNKKLAETG